MEVFCKLSVLQLPEKLTTFEEHHLGGVFIHFNAVFQTHHNLPGSRISLQNTLKFYQEASRKGKSVIKFHKFSCKTHFYVLNRLKFVNYKKNSFCRTPPKLPGVKHRENTCFIYVVRWLLLGFLSKEHQIAGGRIHVFFLYEQSI